MTYSFALQSDCWRQVLDVEQSQNSVYETVMSPAQAAAATHSLVNTDTSRLGVLLWFLIHSDAAMSSLKSTRVRVNPDDALAIYRDEWTAFGHEVGRDEIDWWVNRKETNLAEFSKRTALALESAQALKESSQALKKIDVERYEELIEQIKTFAVKQSAALELARGKSSVITLNPATCGHLKTGHLSRSKDDSFDQPPSFQATSVAGGGFRVFALNSIVKHGGGRPLDHESRRRPVSFARHPYRLGICHKWPVFK